MTSDNTVTFLCRIQEELDDESVPVHSTVEMLRTELVNISSNCFPPVNLFGGKNRKTYNKAKWFDNDCKSSKKLLNLKRKLYQKELRMNSSIDSLSVLRNEYFDAGRQYKKVLKSKRRQYMELEKTKLLNLKTNDPKSFWKALKGKRPISKLNFENIELSDYFNKLLTCENDSMPFSKLECESNIDDEVSQYIDCRLNTKITIDEVKQMARSLKTGKSAGIDMINAEQFKYLPDPFLNVFTSLFNKILDSGEFPEEWAIGIIVLLFKSGDKSDLNNYRGITLLSIFWQTFLRYSS